VRSVRYGRDVRRDVEMLEFMLGLVGSDFQLTQRPSRRKPMIGTVTPHSPYIHDLVVRSIAAHCGFIHV
jgi:hypothetical protein